MKKRCIALLLGGAVMVATSAVAHDGTINITGSFRSSTCVLALNDKDISVPFGDISSSHFKQSGDSSPAVSFTIHLQDCGADVTNVNVTFNGTPDTVNTKLLGIDTGTNSASGLGVAILDYTRTLLPIKEASVNYPLVPGDVPLVFYAQLRSTQNDIGAGEVHANATFSFHYE